MWQPADRYPDPRIETLHPSFERYRIFSAAVERLTPAWQLARSGEPPSQLRPKARIASTSANLGGTRPGRSASMSLKASDRRRGPGRASGGALPGEASSTMCDGENSPHTSANVRAGQPISLT